MRFALVPLLGKEVKAVGFERGDVFSHLDWSQPDRWRLDFSSIERELRGAVANTAAGKLPSTLVLQLQVYDFTVWGDVFGKVGFGSTYSRPKRELTLSVRLNYTKVKNLDAKSQCAKVLSGLLRSAKMANETIDTPTTVSLSDVYASLKAASVAINPERVAAVPGEA